jgi:hypothetical protein
MKELRHWIFCWFAIMAWSPLFGQASNPTVSLHYDKEPLGGVLTDLSKRYAVRFSYSTNFVPVNKQVTVHAERIELKEGLNLLFRGTRIVYAYMGGQYVLKIDPNKQLGLAPLSRLKTQTRVVRQQQIDRQRKPQLPERRPKLTPVPTLKRVVIRNVPGNTEKLFVIDRTQLTLTPLDEYNKRLEETRIAQISLLSFVGTNARRSGNVVNNVSLNLLWGTNGGVEGMEVGGLVNNIRNNVKGVQVAGLGNHVGGKVIGTQLSGLFNVSRGKVQGVQFGGLFNVSGAGDAVQTAGVFNVSNGDFAGIQASGLFNVSKGEAKGLQFSGLFNTAGGTVKTQLSGLFNVAEDVEYGQVSALINVGKRVEGFQIGLINVSDTISGIPLGLLNIVRNGYNRFEMGASETMFANLGMKLGAKAFYNIFNLGVTWEERVERVSGMDPKTRTSLYWSVGYGIGTAVRIAPAWLINFELISSHVNERRFWDSTLNQLNQFRMLFAVRTGRTAAFYAGPVANLMVSKLYDPDTGLYGSDLMPYTMYDQTNNNTNVKGWIGFHAGIRF